MSATQALDKREEQQKDKESQRTDVNKTTTSRHKDGITDFIDMTTGRQYISDGAGWSLISFDRPFARLPSTSSRPALS